MGWLPIGWLLVLSFGQHLNVYNGFINMKNFKPECYKPYNNVKTWIFKGEKLSPLEETQAARTGARERERDRTDRRGRERRGDRRGSPRSRNR